MLLGWRLGRCQQDTCARSWAGGNRMYTKHSGSLSFRKQAAALPGLINTLPPNSGPLPEASHILIQRTGCTNGRTGHFSMTLASSVLLPTVQNPQSGYLLVLSPRSVWSCSLFAYTPRPPATLNCLCTCPTDLLTPAMVYGGLLHLASLGVCNSPATSCPELTSVCITVHKFILSPTVQYPWNIHIAEQHVKATKNLPLWYKLITI